jgi:hypothetical protein
MNWFCSTPPMVCVRLTSKEFIVCERTELLTVHVKTHYYDDNDEYDVE